MDLFANVISSTLSSQLIAPMSWLHRAVYAEGDSTPFHSAVYFNSILAEEGEAVFQEKGERELLCERGSFIVIPSGISYKWRIKKRTVLLQCLHKPFSFLEHRNLGALFGNANKRLTRVELDERTLAESLKSLAADERDAEPARGLKMSADWLKVMAEAASEFHAVSSDEHPSLARAVAYLEANVERNVALPELSANCGLGVSRLSQLFREQLGMSPLRYHSMLKAELAAGLLAEGRLSAGEIADKLGFASTCAFRHFYKRKTGFAPGRSANRKTRR